MNKNVMEINHIINENYFNKIQNIQFQLVERQDNEIGKILINIYKNSFNKTTHKNKIDDKNEVLKYKKNIEMLCLKYDNNKIIFILLTEIRRLISKCFENIVEMPFISQLYNKKLNIKDNEKFFLEQSEEFVSKKYIDFRVEQKNRRSKSLNKAYVEFNYYNSVESLFKQLIKMKDFLKETAPMIEQIFENPLKEFEKFSIYDCEKEEYYDKIVNNPFIFGEININRFTKLNDLIIKLLNDYDKNNVLMTQKIEFFQKSMERSHKNQLNDLILSEVGSSIEERYPEDAKPDEEIIEKGSEFYFPSNIDFDIEKLLEKITHEHNKKEEEISTTEFIKSKGEKKYFEIPKILKKKEEIQGGIADSSDNIQNDIEFNIPKKMNLINNYDKPRMIPSKPSKKPDIISYPSKCPKKEKVSNKQQIKKNEKKEIPSDIDDLVKYIENDNINNNNKKETETKKKKRNRKKNKKKKNENKDDNKGDDSKIKEDIKYSRYNEEIEEIKKDLLNYSINRFEIHKVKFKYTQSWLEKLANYIK